MNGLAGGKIAGIPIALDASFLVLVLLYSVGHVETESLVGVIVGGFIVAGAAGSILLHELGHAAAARLCGVTPLYIELHGLGGFCHMNRAGATRAERVFISLAGPAANFALWGLFFWLSLETVSLVAWFSPQELAHVGRSGGALGLALGAAGAFGALSSLNIAMFVFNMVPSFPLDGGHAALELLPPRFDLAAATRVIATLGFCLCGYLVYSGLTSGGAWEFVLAYSLFMANRQALATLGRRVWRRWN